MAAFVAATRALDAARVLRYGIGALCHSPDTLQNNLSTTTTTASILPTPPNTSPNLLPIQHTAIAPYTTINDLAAAIGSADPFTRPSLDTHTCFNLVYAKQSYYGLSWSFNASHVMLVLILIALIYYIATLLRTISSLHCTLAYQRSVTQNSGSSSKRTALGRQTGEELVYLRQKIQTMQAAEEERELHEEQLSSENAYLKAQVKRLEGTIGPLSGKSDRLDQLLKKMTLQTRNERNLKERAMEEIDKRDVELDDASIAIKGLWAQISKLERNVNTLEYEKGQIAREVTSLQETNTNEKAIMKERLKEAQLSMGARADKDHESITQLKRELGTTYRTLKDVRVESSRKDEQIVKLTARLHELQASSATGTNPFQMFMDKLSSSSHSQVHVPEHQMSKADGSPNARSPLQSPPIVDLFYSPSLLGCSATGVVQSKLTMTQPTNWIASIPLGEVDMNLARRATFKPAGIPLNMVSNFTTKKGARRASAALIENTPTPAHRGSRRYRI